MLGVHLPERPVLPCPPELDRIFDFIVFDWDGTAVESRSENASEVRELIEGLLRRGVGVAIVTGTSLAHLEKQLSGMLHNRHLRVSTNRGSEGWAFETRSSPILLMRRVASPEEEKALTETALAVAEVLEKRWKLEVAIIHDRMNRRKIDLVPEPDFADPPKSELPKLVSAVQNRLQEAGIEGGLREIVELSREMAREHGLEDPRITTDAKHVEIGLTDKGDALRWMLQEANARPSKVLVIGDELGPLGGVSGSDSLMMIPEAKGATFVSVGPEPNGVPPDVLRLGGGPAAFRALLAHQVALHEKRRRPKPSPEPLLPEKPTEEASWTVVEAGFELAREHEIEAIFTIANGHAGLRGSLSEGSSLSSAKMLVAGLFAGSPVTQMPEFVVAPDPTRLRLTIDHHALSLEKQDGRNRRILDLRQGALFREWRPRTPDGRVTSYVELKLASLAERDLFLQSLTLVPENYSGILELELLTLLPFPEAPPGSSRGAPLSLSRVEAPSPSRLCLELRAEGASSPLALAISTFITSESGEPLPRVVEKREDGVVERFVAPLEIGRAFRLSRLICVQTKRDGPEPFESAKRRIESIVPVQIREVAEAHREAWAERWRIADIVIEGDERAERALRFAAYHLISSADPDDPRVSIGARGFSGTAYAGHVFWDTDIFMLPFFTLTHPESAKALLGYRHATLAEAKKRAREFGYEGALFAWESALSGRDVTPRYSIAPDGEVVAIHTGELQHHISADIAYAAWSYWQATSDDEFFIDRGAELIIETARFWASRGRFGDDGRYHIDDIIGPDEYHVGVSDNAFTNGLARFNLLRAEACVLLLRDSMGARGREKLEALALVDTEPETWRKLAEAMYLHIDPRTLVIEQFRGFFELEEIDLRGLDTGSTLPIDVVLGRERVANAQIVKQPDVLMLLHLLPDEFPREVLEANFRYYEPRTAHGSSLSPGIHASLAARLGFMDLAVKYFDDTASMDLYDRVGNAASGVHMATLGSLWQAIVFGCAGISIGADGIVFDPHPLPSFRTLLFSIRYRRTTLRIRIRKEPLSIEVEASGEDPVRISARHGPTARIEPGHARRITKSAEGFVLWEET